MSPQIDELIHRIKELQEELEVEFNKKRNEFQFVIEEKRIRFAEEVARQQRRFKTGWFRYVIQARLFNVLTAPVIYSGFVPFILLDLFLWFYQSSCFPIYGIAKVKREAYLVFDREDLPYLNVIEKFNCFYCAYGNGLIGYAREIAARTEQYWCPIKHARRIKAAHEHYPKFFEFGDAESYQKGLERLRAQMKAHERNSESTKPE
ncbi:MAG: hypothetical protein JXR80_09900 [Deltaproteobacteria bacterium]|nr:hypothetical protein [Deltaproteobacteria bacterium]